MSEDIEFKFKKDSTPVKDNWFKAYLEANINWPQMGFDLGSVKIISTVLNDPDFDWSKFNRSELSEDQIAKLRQSAEKIHHTKDIKARFSDDRLGSLWNAARFNVQQFSLGYIRYVYSTDTRESSFPRHPSIAVAEEFFQNNPSEFEKLKKLAFDAAGILDEPQLRNLSKAYRETFNRKIGVNNYAAPDILLESAKLVRDKLCENYSQELIEHSVGTVARLVQGLDDIIG